MSQQEQIRKDIHQPGKQLSPLEATWLACAIDGEGYIHIERKESKFAHHKLVIGVYNTDVRFVEKARDCAGCGYVFRNNTGKSNPLKPNSLIWAFRITRYDDAIRILGQLEPFFVIKGERARNALDECLRKVVLSRRNGASGGWFIE